MQATDGPSTSADRQVGRYSLEDIVAGDAGGSVWRAVDTTLSRTVALRLVASTDPRVASLRAAATAAAAVVDRRVVRVLDVFDTEDSLVIVSEWVDGVTLADLTHSSLPPGRTIRMAKAVADALLAIEAAGTFHGRLTPSCVVISHDGEIRLRGHGINAALWGINPGADPHLADTFAVGAVLLACTTTRWATGPIDGLRGAPLIGGFTAAPNQLVADVPSDLEVMTVRALAAPRISSSPPISNPYNNVAEVASDLALAEQGQFNVNPTEVAHQPSRRVRRATGVVAGLAAAVLLGVIGVSVLTLGQPNNPDSASAQAPAEKQAVPQEAVVPQAAAPPGTDPVNPVPARVERPLTIVSARAFDPYGDGADNSSTVNGSFDSDAGTAWRTNVYKDARPDGKPGVGVIFDMGQAKQISAIELGLIGNDTDVQVRVSNDAISPTDPKAFNKLPVFATAVGAPTSASLRVPRPQAGRYVVVWLTKLSWASNGYQSGISNIVVRGQ